MSYWDSLQPASFRGVPFGVVGAEGRFGRRNVVHEYPYRDTVWVEDLGRSPRRISLVGFLVENSLLYAGGDVIAQRDRMISAAERPGDGILIHPTLGRLTVSCLSVATRERWDQGRVIELGFSFVEAGKLTFPTNATSTGDAVLGACSLADAAAGSDFGVAVATALPQGAAVVGQAMATTGDWTGIASGLASRATSLFNLVAALPGNFGRFVGQALGNAFSGVGIAGLPSVSVSGLISTGAQLRATVAAAVNAAGAAAAVLSLANTGPYVTGIQAVATALLATGINPAGAIRLMIELGDFTPSRPTTSSPTGRAMATMQGAVGDLCRRAAVVAVARASVSYQPTSYDDAAAVRSTVTGLLDAEITIAGDQGQDATYAALRALRVAVAQDLTTRGASLAHMETVATPEPQTALTLAHRLYQDASRADELVDEAAPIHPAFLPTSFRALAS